MRRTTGIVVQITLLMVLVVFPAIVLLNNRMTSSAREVVVDHEQVDLNEETQLQGWHLRSRVDLLRQDTFSVADAFIRQMRRGRSGGPPRPATEVITDELLKTALPDVLLERYQRVEVFPVHEAHPVPQALIDRCESVSAAGQHPTHSRTELLEQLRQNERPLDVMLSPTLYRESQPFVLKPDVMEKLPTRFATDENPNPLVWPNNYHVLWAGVKVPTHSSDESADGSSDENGDWIILISLGLDDSFRGIAGSPRHLGFLYDQERTLYLHPTRMGELAAGGLFERKADERYEIFEGKLLEDFQTAERLPSGLEIGIKDREPRTLKQGQQFYFCETKELELRKEQQQVVLRLIKSVNNTYLDEEWSADEKSGAGRRRVAAILTDQLRIRALASSPDELDNIRDEVEDRLRKQVGIEGELSWRMKPVHCHHCLASQVRIDLVPAGSSRAAGIHQLTLIRAAFDEELAADLAAELSTVEWDAYFGGLIAVVVAFGLSLLITRPLKRITRAAQEISRTVGQHEGDDSPLLNGFLEELPDRRPDEIGDLAQAFRNLVRQVQDYAATIRERESFLRGIHDTAMDGIMTIDEAGRIRSFNPAAEQIFAWSAEEVIGKHFAILYPPAVATELMRSLENYLATGEAKLLGRRSVWTGLRKDGTTFPLELSVNQVAQAGGHCIFASLLRDITERKEAERARDLLVANEEKTHALREIAHETMNDLTAILGAADQYRRRFGDLVSQKQSELLARIEKSARSLVDFVVDLREIARISEGTIELDRMDFSPLEVIEDALATLRPKFVARNHRVYVELEDTPRSIHADKSRCRQVIKNLLSNACKYTPAGGSITVRAAVVDEDFRLEVADTGIGIPDEDREKVFRDFGRASNADSQASGQGLGLALCRRIVAMHGGTIDFESRLGEGSTFWVRFPLRPRPGDPLVDRSSVQPQPVVHRGFRIVVAETSQRRADELTELLSGDGHAVEVVHDGEQLVAQIAEDRPDVVLTILNLPGLNAREAVQQIRSLPDGDSLPVILLTRVDVPDVQALGFTGSLKLPVERDNLRRILTEKGIGAASPMA